MTGRRPKLLTLLLLVGGCGGDPEPPPVRVAAAADLTFAFEELGRLFEEETGHRVTFSFGSTGLLAQQLRFGAPFDLFAAANVSFVDQVVGTGVCDEATVAPYARGRVAVWSRAGGVAPPTSLDALRDPRFARIAIANPEHAPYGQAAKQALETAGVWTEIESRLVYGENVRQALQFAETGNVEAALVALSLVIQDDENPWMLIADELHDPIDQALVVCTEGDQRAGGEAFARFVNEPAGRVVMQSYGFLLPGEEPRGGP